MDILGNLTLVILGQESAYIAGIIAAFTPCMLAIIPIFLYRFGVWGGKERKVEESYAGFRKIAAELALFILGFFFSFTLTGLLLNQLTNSAYVNATRLTLSFILILVGVLQIFHRANIQFFNRFTNPLLLGLVTPFVVSLSPCVLPYFSLILANADVAATLPKFVLFGLGILTPPIIIALFGNFALNIFRRSTRLLALIERWSPLLILLSGIYLGSQLIEITQQDIVISGIITLGIILLTTYNIFRIPEQRTYQNMRNFFFVVVLWAAISLNLLTMAPQSSLLTNETLINYCVLNSMTGTCAICAHAELLYILLAIALGLTIVRSSKKGTVIKISY